MKKVFFSFIFLFLLVFIFLHSSSVKAQTQLSWTQNSVNIVHTGYGTVISQPNGCIRLTNSVPPGTPAQGSGFWSKTQVDLSKSFTLNFDMFFGCDSAINITGGDGMVFVLQDAATGLSSLGGLGGNIGFWGIAPSVGIEFDTWQNLEGYPNAADTGMVWNHTDLMLNGNIYPAPYPGGDGRQTPMYPIGKDPIHGMDGDVEDCIQYPYTITWDVTTHTMTLTQRAMTMNGITQAPFQIFSYQEDFVNDVFGGNSIVYWGFVGSTGGSSNEQWVCPEYQLANWVCMDYSCCAKYVVKPNTDSVMCTNNLTIGVSGNYAKYNWSTGDTTSAISVSNPGKYTLNVLQNQSGYLCPSSTVINVTTKGPTGVLSGTAAICNDGTGTSPISVALTGTPPWTVQYSKNGITQPAVPGINTSPYTFNDSLGTYALVYVKDASVCNGFPGGTATISAYPDLPQGINGKFCPTSPATLRVTNNGGTYQWYNQPTNGTLLDTGATYTTPPLSVNTTYYVTNVDNTLLKNKSVGYLNTSDPASTKNAGSGQGYNTISFTANKDFKIISIDAVVMDLGSCAGSSIKLTLTDLTVPKNTTVTYPNSCSGGTHIITVPCNFSIISGHNYTLAYDHIGNMIPIFYWSLCPAYPITKDAEITFTGATPTNQSTVYPGLFNWQIQYGSPAAGCGRTPVEAIASVVTASVKDTTLSCNASNSGVLTAIPGTGATPFTYSWSNGKTTATITGLVAGAFTVTVTDSTGCSAKVTANVNIPGAIVASVSPDVIICNGKSTILTAGGSTNFLWSTGDTTARITVAPTVSTTYTVTVSNNNKCFGTDQVVVTIDDGCKLTPVLSAPPVCLGDTATVTLKVLSLKPYTLTWSDPSVKLTGDGSFKIYSVSDVTYSVTATENSDPTISNTSTIVVVVNPLPTVTLSGGTVCMGTTAIITAAGANIYTWSNGSGSGTSNTVNPTITTTYSVTGTDVNKCSNTSQAIVMVYSLPTVTAGGGIICSGESINVTASGANNYNWSNGMGSGSSVKVNPVITTTYIVSGTNSNNCINTALAIIMVNPLPAITAGNGIICSGLSATITAGGTSTLYVWSNGLGNSSSVTVNPVITTTYTVTGTDGNTCTNTAQAIVTVNPLPTVTANPSIAKVCAGQQVTLKGNGANSYTWDNGITDNTAFSPAMGTTIYAVTGSDINNCVNTAQAVVTVNFLPTITAIGGTICSGGSVSITAGGATTYNWSNGLGNGSSVTVNPAVTTIFLVTGTDSNNCTNTAQSVVTVNVLPEVPVISDTTICLNEVKRVTLSIRNPNAGYTYEWYGSSAGADSLSQGTSYTVNNISQTKTIYIKTITNAGCIDPTRKPVTITVGELPQAAFNYDPEQIIQHVTTVNFYDATIINNSAITNWIWFPGDSTTPLNGKSVTHIYNNAGPYVVMLIVENTEGCKDTATKNIKVLPMDTINIPNVFTPNGDGINDYLYIKGIDYGEWQLIIYNRWGRKVYENNHYDNNDNKWTAEGCSEGVYYYVLKNAADSKQTKTGYVELIR